MSALEEASVRIAVLMNDTTDAFQASSLPEGYLLKAGEGRLFGSAAFKKRYFRVVPEKGTLSYFADQDATKAKGNIDIRQIQSVDLLSDKERLVLKLKTPGRVFTLAADTDEVLAQWVAKLTKMVIAAQEAAPAANNAPNKKKRGSMVGRRLSAVGGMFGIGSSSSSSGDVRPPGTISAYNYDVEFIEGPLHMDLEADESDRPTVLSFSKTAAGDIGPAQASEKILIGDALVKCNEEDLSDYDFTDAIAVVVASSWPRTLTFERPAAEPVPDAEGWLFKQGDSATSTLRRRLFKLYGDTLFYYKPSRLNASKAGTTPSGNIQMKNVNEIKIVHDKRQSGNKQYRLEIHTEGRVWLICPNSIDGLTYWAPLLSKSRGADDIIPCSDLQVIETGPSNEGEEKSGASAVGQGEIHARKVELPDGPLVYKGKVHRKDFFSEVRRPRMLRLHMNRLLFTRLDRPDLPPYRINVDDLARAARLINPGAPEGQRDTVRVDLKDGTSHEFMTENTDSAVAWITQLRELGAKRAAAEDGNGEDGGGEDSDGNRKKKRAMTLEVAEGTEDESVSRARTNSMMTPDEVEHAAEDKEEQKEVANEEEAVDHVKTSRAEGWMYKLGEAKFGSLGAYRKRWFSLQKSELPYYKHRAVGILARNAAGRINFRNVLEVRQSAVPGCPDNTIEVVTPGRVYTIVPDGSEENDTVFDLWMSELSNAADIYGKEEVEAQKAAAKRNEDEAIVEQERITLLKASIARSGMLAKKGQVVKTMKQVR